MHNNWLLKMHNIWLLMSCHATARTSQLALAAGPGGPPRRADDRDDRRASGYLNMSMVIWEDTNGHIRQGNCLTRSGDYCCHCAKPKFQAKARTNSRPLAVRTPGADCDHHLNMGKTS